MLRREGAALAVGSVGIAVLVFNTFVLSIVIEEGIACFVMVDGFGSDFFLFHVDSFDFEMLSVLVLHFSLWSFLFLYTFTQLCQSSSDEYFHMLLYTQNIYGVPACSHQVRALGYGFLVLDEKFEGVIIHCFEHRAHVVRSSVRGYDFFPFQSGCLIKPFDIRKAYVLVEIFFLRNAVEVFGIFRP